MTKIIPFLIVKIKTVIEVVELAGVWLEMSPQFDTAPNLGLV